MFESGVRTDSKHVLLNAPPVTVPFMAGAVAAWDGILFEVQAARPGEQTLGEDPGRVLAATRVGTEGRVNAARCIR
jgi:hypothetical protein